MKKTVIMWKKVGEYLKPAHYREWNDMQASVPDGGWLQGVFSKPKKPKSNPQLGYLYAGIYPHFIAFYSQTQGYIFQIQKENELINIEPNVISVDLYLKTLFCIHKSIKEFSKEKASIEDLNEYIEFLNNHSVERFQCGLPPSKIKE